MSLFIEKIINIDYLLSKERLIKLEITKKKLLQISTEFRNYKIINLYLNFILYLIGKSKINDQFLDAY